MIRIRAINNLGEAEEEIRRVGAGERGIEIMAPKALHKIIKIDSMDVRAACILKQEMLSIGGEAAVSRDSLRNESRTTDALLMGSVKQYSSLIKKLTEQPFGLKDIADEIRKLLEYIEGCPRPIKIGDRLLDWSEKTYIMGILNITPDSFSGDGLLNTTGDILSIAKKMVADGADILDVGGESTKPGAESISVDEEISRVVPVIKEISGSVDAPISIDSYKPDVVYEAIKAGASLVNDISGLRSKGMAGVVAEEEIPVVLMHMQGTPRDMQNNPTYDSVVGDILAFFKKQINYAIDAGIDRDRIIVDPGIGFGKSTQHNLELINRLSEFRSLGLPILIGPSRKSFIGNILNLPVTERLEGTLAAVSSGILNGAGIVRVHDVEAVSKAVKVADAIKKARYS